MASIAELEGPCSQQYVSDSDDNVSLCAEADLMRRLRRSTASENGEDVEQAQHRLPCLPGSDPKRVAATCQRTQLPYCLLAATAAQYSQISTNQTRCISSMFHEMLSVDRGAEYTVQKCTDRACSCPYLQEYSISIQQHNSARERSASPPGCLGDSHVKLALQSRQERPSMLWCALHQQASHRRRFCTGGVVELGPTQYVGHLCQILYR